MSLIDIETTGGRARDNKITEIAIINIDDGLITETFSTLIHPERSIPYGITRLTGITDQMVASAPKFYQVAKKIVQMTEGRIFVAHNVHFDYQFIKAEFRSLGHTFRRDRLCTVRLARKFLPGHKSYSLGRLCSDLGIIIEGRHRAMGDAMATSELFSKIYNEQGKTKLEAQVEKKVNFPPYFDQESFDTLPEAPGLYYLWDRYDCLLYIGKAKNLKKRVRQHFDVKGEKSREYQFKNRIAKVTIKELGHELPALLFESYEIKRKTPLHNVSLKRKILPYHLKLVKDRDGLYDFEVLKGLDGSEFDFSFASKLSAQTYIKKVIKKAFAIHDDNYYLQLDKIEQMKKILGPYEYNKRVKKVFEKGLELAEVTELNLKCQKSRIKSVSVEYIKNDQVKLKLLDNRGDIEFISFPEDLDMRRIFLNYRQKSFRQ